MASRRDIYWIQNWSERHLEVGCRLVEKAWRQGYRVHVRVVDETQARRFSESLWSFKASAFVPHRCFDAKRDEAAPESALVIGVGSGPPPEGLAPDLLLRLNGELETPSGADESGCRRVAEMLPDTDEARAAVGARLDEYRAANGEVFEHSVPGRHADSSP